MWIDLFGDAHRNNILCLGSRIGVKLGAEPTPGVTTQQHIQLNSVFVKDSSRQCKRHDVSIFLIFLKPVCQNPFGFNRPRNAQIFECIDTHKQHIAMNDISGVDPEMGGGNSSSVPEKGATKWAHPLPPIPASQHARQHIPDVHCAIFTSGHDAIALGWWAGAAESKKKYCKKMPNVRCVMITFNLCQKKVRKLPKISYDPLTQDSPTPKMQKKGGSNVSWTST